MRDLKKRLRTSEDDHKRALQDSNKYLATVKEVFARVNPHIQREKEEREKAAAAVAAAAAAATAAVVKKEEPAAVEVKEEPAEAAGGEAKAAAPVNGQVKD